ncbi:MAG TPA: nucleotidyltransferase domain-containing protein, partial [Rhabdochlamydiaceae bacterium]
KKDIFVGLNQDLSWLEDNSLFITLHGSHCYGLATETSDIDIRGIAISPRDYMLGFNKSFDQLVVSDPYDMQIFDLIKFFRLTKDNNPNTLELLYTEPEDHIFVSPLGQKLIDNRDLFLSRAIKERYIGYSKAQAHRIRSHKTWLDKEGEMKPPMSREEFGLKKELSISRDQLLTIQAMINKKLDSWNCDFEPFSEPQTVYLQGKFSKILSEMNITSDNKWECAARSLGADENFIYLLQREKAYQHLVSDYNNYLTWKKNRNPKRAELEKKIGYDSKHATQLIRLLLVGKEALLTSKLRVKRTDDREMLMEIKNCQWPYEKLIALADKIEKEVEEAYFKSPLPIKPDVQKLDELCISMIEESLGKNNESRSLY